MTAACCAPALALLRHLEAPALERLLAEGRLCGLAQIGY